MKLDDLALEEFKDYLIQSMNEDIYYQLKDWIAQGIDEDQDYDSVMQFFLNNLHGSLTWSNDV